MLLKCFGGGGLGTWGQALLSTYSVFDFTHDNAVQTGT